MCSRFSVSKLPFIPEYRHPTVVLCFTGKLSVKQNLNPHIDVILPPCMCTITKIKQCAEQQTAIEQPLSEKRREVWELQMAMPDMEEEIFFEIVVVQV